MLSLGDWFFFLALFLIFLLPPTDPDLGWHLRCGQEIWQQGSFCGQNQFSVLLENYSWPNHAWLYQAMIFPLFKTFGLWGLTILNGFLMILAFAFFYLAIKNFRFEKMLAAFLIILLGWGVFSFGTRSQLVGFLFFNFTLWLLSKIEQRPKLIFLLPPTMLIWANSHGSVILGLILLVFFWLKAAVKRQNRLPLLAAISLLSAVATLLNPFGFRIYQEAWRHFAVVDLSKLIAEWVPPVPIIWELVLLSGLGLFFYLLFAPEVENKVLALLVPFFTFWALKARRNIPFYFSLTFWLLLNSPTTKKILAIWLENRLLRSLLSGLIITAFLIYSLFVRLPRTMEANRSWQNYCQASSLNFPHQAVEFLRSQSEGGLPAGRQGNIFNRYEWGGFLIWQLPEYKIFVDGRMPAWPTPSGKSPYTIYLETLQTQPGWEKTLDEYHIGWILISPGTFMDLLLEPDPEKFGWQEVYRDKISVVYRRL